MIDYNYPVKYAVMTVLKEGGWLNGYEDITVGHIVSKCYLIESKLRYYRNGTHRLTHNVLFPYQDIESYKRCGKLIQRIYPHLTASGEVSDTKVVQYIFDDYDEAKSLKEKLNEDFIIGSISDLWIKNNVSKSKFEEYKNSLIEEIKFCDKFEIDIEEKLKDMKLTHNAKTLRFRNE